MLDQRDFWNALLNYRNNDCEGNREELVDSLDFMLRNVSDQEVEETVINLNLSIGVTRLVRAMQELSAAINFASAQQ